MSKNNPSPSYWLMKSEPDEFSITDLQKKGVHHWDGVRNYQARNAMRDDMRIDDFIIFYHSSAQNIGAVGVAQVASLPYPDHTQFNSKSKYYDPKATKEKPIWFMVDVRFVELFPRIFSRKEMKAEQKLSHMLLWKYMRLSITALTKNEFTIICKHANTA